MGRSAMRALSNMLPAMTRITGARTLDVRAPTSITLAGSDAVHQDPDYSGAYVFLSTDGPHEGVGMTFTVGRGNDLCCAAIEQLAPLVVGRDLEELVADGAAFWRRLTNDGQLRWLGPEKGVIHLATAALVNAVWDLWARVEGKPLWQLVCDLSPEQFVASVDFRYLTDVLDRDEALDMLRALAPTRAERVAELARDGYPAYLTSAGWLGYDEATVRDLCRAGARRRLALLQDEGRPRRGGRRPPVRGDARGDRRPPAHGRRQPGVGRPRGDRTHAPPRAVRPAVDRGADESRRRARSRGHPPGRRARRCRDG